MLTPSPIDTASIIPKTLTDYQSLQLIQQLQHHVLSNNQALLLFIILSLPIPVEWRLNIYYSLSSNHLPFFTSVHLSPFMMTVLIVSWPVFAIVSLILLYFFIRFIISMLRMLLPKAFAGLHKDEGKIMLELTFPHNTSKSAYSTEQLFSHLHALSKRQTLLERLLGIKRTYALEITASRNDGIRYIFTSPPKDSDIVKRWLLSYLPGIKIQEVKDYLNEDIGNAENDRVIRIVELKLAGHFALPLSSQSTLSEHDPISYITGSMTKLLKGELVSFQIITAPVLKTTHGKLVSKMREIRTRMYKQLPLTDILNEDALTKFTSLPVVSIFWFILKCFGKLLSLIGLFIISIPSAIMDTSGKSVPILMSNPKIQLQEALNPYEKELGETVKGKIDQNLFETSIRLLVMGEDAEEVDIRTDGLLASFAPFSSAFQTIIPKGNLFSFLPFALKKQLAQFKERKLATDTAFNQNPILSLSELSDIYHLPYTNITKTEGLVKSKSRDLPAPLSMKKSNVDLDVVVGKNSYGGEELPVGLTTVDRRQHTYIIGKTGMGKSTIIKQMALQDIENGKGIAVIDPHGDLVQDLLKLIPRERIKDVIYVNPSDKQFPVGLNILASKMEFADIDEEHERIARGLMSVFMKITPKEHWGQRMEHILRNATLTALLAKAPTVETPYISLLTIQKLLTDKIYQKQISSTLSDPVLKQFWEKEFSIYGKLQLASVISPLTNKLGEFITSKMSRYILLQEKSTINMQDIMNKGKILLVNLSKGDLGEERSAFFGTLITSLIQLATYSRTTTPEHKRRDFFVYIDEFQNFATEHFTDLFSESRKYHVFFIASHQNIAQIDDQKLTKVIMGNSGNMIALKNGPDDEKLLLPFLEPEVEKGQIINLPPHHFFMKVTNNDSEDAFSGETQLIEIKENEHVAKEIIESSRKNYATPKEIVEKQIGKLFTQNTDPIPPKTKPLPKKVAPKKSKGQEKIATKEKIKKIKRMV